MVHYATKSIYLPQHGGRLHTLTRKLKGAGYGTVLLDGGHGGQSSYHGIDDYIRQTGNNPQQMAQERIKQLSGRGVGNGLDDKIRDKLSKLTISSTSTVSGKPKRKNIVMSI